MARITVACVLKSGGDFDEEYVHHLSDGVQKYLNEPHRFICLSDVKVPCERVPLKYDYPGWWSKMELFRPDLNLGDVFYIDLDTIIVGNLAPLVADMSKPLMLAGCMSSIMSLPSDCRSSVWKEWVKDPKSNMDRLGYDKDRKDIAKRAAIYHDLSEIGDQAFIRKNITAQDYPAGFFCSYLDVAKSHSEFSGPNLLTKPRKHRFPKTLSAIIFNNRPRPRDVNWLKNTEIEYDDLSPPRRL